ncbi:hypothetical protein ACB098_02G006100 [Castanea mollissima]
MVHIEASVHPITQDCSSNKTKKTKHVTFRRSPYLEKTETGANASSDQRSSSPPPTRQILRLEKHEGPPHDKKYVSSVQIPTVDGILYIEGDEKSRVKEAQNSAASWIVRALQESNYL